MHDVYNVFCIVSDKFHAYRYVVFLRYPMHTDTVLDRAELPWGWITYTKNQSLHSSLLDKRPLPLRRPQKENKGQQLQREGRGKATLPAPLIMQRFRSAVKLIRQGRVPPGSLLRGREALKPS